MIQKGFGLMGRTMWLSSEEEELIELVRHIGAPDFEARRFSFVTMTTEYGSVNISLFYQRHNEPKTKEEMPINSDKAFSDLLEIQQLVKSTDEIEKRNAILQDEEAKLLPRLIDKIVTNPTERRALKRALTLES